MIEPESPIVLTNWKGVNEHTSSLLLLNEEAEDNQNCLTDEQDGQLSKTKGFVKIGELGSTLVVDNCDDSSVAWVAASGNSVARDTTNTVEGTAGVAITIVDGFTTGIAAYHNITAIDLSGYTKIGFWVKSSIALAAGDYEFVIDETAACVTPEENLDIPALAANRWEYVTLTFASATTTRDVVVSLGINVAVDKGASVLYVDGFEAISTSAFLVDTCETTWTGATSGSTSVTSSVTSASTYVKAGTYSAKHIIPAGYVAGLLSSHTITSMNLSKYSRVGFWIQSSIDLVAGSLSLLLDDTSACVTPLETMVIDVPLVANIWKYVTVRLAVASTDTTIISVGLKSNATNTSAYTVYIDDIRALKPVKKLYSYIKADGSAELIANNGNAIFKSTDSGNNWSLIATGFNNSYPLSFTNVDGDLFWCNGDSYCGRYTSAGKVICYAAAVGNAYYMPKGRVIWAHQENTLMLGYATDTATVKYSDPAYTADENGWFTASRSKDLQADTGDYITRAVNFGERSIIFLNRNFFVLTGYDSTDFNWMPRNMGVGCTQPESVQIKDQKLIFANQDGVYAIDESFLPQKVSTPIEPSYNNLAQPVIVNNIWTQTLEGDFKAGTYGTEVIDAITTTGKIYQKAQTSATDWDAGIHTEVDIATSSGSVVALLGSGSAFGTDLALNKTCTSAGTVGSSIGSYAVDGNDSTYFYGVGDGVSVYPYVYVDLTASRSINKITLKHYHAGASAYIQYSTNASTWTTLYTIPSTPTPQTDTYNFASPVTARYVRVISSSYSNAYTIFIYTLNVYEAYNSGGSITTQTLDYGLIPTTQGNLTAQVTIPTGCSIQFLAESLAADTGWATYTSLGTATEGNTNFTAVMASYVTARRYVRIKAILNPNTACTLTPILHSLVIGGTYISAIHDTGGSISEWGTFDVEQVLENQSIDYYIRTSTSAGTITSASWIAVNDGQTITESVSNQFIQWKAEFNTLNYNNIPKLDAVTISWVTSSGSTLPSTQVASIVDNNRYYLFATKNDEYYNYVGFCIDKKWNFQKIRYYPVGSACIHRYNPYAGSSIDGKIFKLFEGYCMDYKDWVDNIETYWDTKRFGIESKGNDKWWKEFITFFDTVTDGDLIVYYDVANTGVWTSLGTVDLTETDGENRYLFTGYIKGRDIKIRLYHTDNSQDIKITKCEIPYEIYERLL